MKLGKSNKKTTIILSMIFLMMISLCVLLKSRELLFMFLFIITLVILSFIYVSTMGRHITIEFLRQIMSDNNLVTYITVANNSRIPILNARIEYLIKNHLTGETKNDSFHIQIGFRKKEYLKIGVESCLAGCIDTYVKEVILSDPFSLFQRRIIFKSEKRYYNLPSNPLISIDSQFLDAFDMESTRYSQRKAGEDPSETFCIREYKEGDRIRSIHWKLSAKEGKTMVKEASLPIDNRIILLLDKCQGLNPRQCQNHVSDLLGISRELIERRINHSIGWYDNYRHKMIIRNVSNNDDSIYAVKECLESPFVQGISTVQHFIENGVTSMWTTYIYISLTEKDIERLRAYGKVNIYQPK